MKGKILSIICLIIIQTAFVRGAVVEEWVSVQPTVGEPPFADFTYSPSQSKVNDTIYFSSNSYDPDGYIVNYTWNLGDGSVKYGERVTHSYAHLGNYSVSLTVKDNNGSVSKRVKTIKIYEKEIDINFILSVTENLSNTTFYYSQGRCFGTEGERWAADHIITPNMSAIGLENVHKEAIDGSLNKRNVVTGYQLSINISDQIWINRSFGNSFPLSTWLSGEHDTGWRDVVDKTSMSYEELVQSQGDGRIWLVEVKLEEQYQWASGTNISHPIILMDNSSNNYYDDTFFMSPTHVVGGGVSICSRDGKMIRENLSNGWVKARINMSVEYATLETYNVIGEISGQDNSKVIIVGAHYDGWWNQGALDNAIGVGIMLGIAKYFKDNNIIPKYKLKFVAFGGEEYLQRGAKDYVNDHPLENIVYMINVDMVAHNGGGPLNITSNSNLTLNKVKNIVSQIYPFSNETFMGTPTATDAAVFAEEDYIVIDFVKENYLYYHRDGGFIRENNNPIKNTHTKGDVMDNINRQDLNATAKLILEVVKYLSNNLITYSNSNNSADDSNDISNDYYADIDVTSNELIIKDEYY